MKECDAKEYDVATYALAELMKQTVGGRENADELGFRWSNVEDAKRILLDYCSHLTRLVL